MAKYSFNTLIVRNTCIPLYIQVIDSLTEFTKFNTNPGYQLPGEAVLCRFFNVRRTVMRQALKEHEYKGHRR